VDDETIKQVAKAAEQVAKTGEVAITSLNAVAKFLYELAGESLVEFAQAGTDKIKAWRLRNLICSAAKTKLLLESSGLAITAESLSPGDAARWLEGAADEEEAEIQELWARLLANALDPAKRLPISKTLVSLLREIRPLDASVLIYLSDQGWNVDVRLTGGFSIRKLAHELSIQTADAWNAIANLWRLGCLLQQVADLRVLDGASIQTVGAAYDEISSFRLSPLGQELIESVERPTDDETEDEA
jgi:hypothetical protein